MESYVLVRAVSVEDLAVEDLARLLGVFDTSSGPSLRVVGMDPPRLRPAPSATWRELATRHGVPANWQLQGEGFWGSLNIWADQWGLIEVGDRETVSHHEHEIAIELSGVTAVGARELELMHCIVTAMRATYAYACPKQEWERYMRDPPSGIPLPVITNYLPGPFSTMYFSARLGDPRKLR